MEDLTGSASHVNIYYILFQAVLRELNIKGWHTRWLASLSGNLVYLYLYSHGFRIYSQSQGYYPVSCRLCKLFSAEFIECCRPMKVRPLH